MPRILLTAFEPYEPWRANSSWLALIALTQNLPEFADITTRLYPVDLEAMKSKLAEDLKGNYDFAIHVGQAPKSSCLQLEEIALNVAAKGNRFDQVNAAGTVCDAGPAAYRTPLPVRAYAKSLRDAGIPARVSFHAGTFLCNTILYWSCRLVEDLELPTKSMFVHVPLDTSQVLDLDEATSFMPAAMAADGIRMLLQLAISEQPQTAV